MYCLVNIGNNTVATVIILPIVMCRLVNIGKLPVMCQVYKRL